MGNFLRIFLYINQYFARKVKSSKDLKKGKGVYNINLQIYSAGTKKYEFFVLGKFQHRIYHQSMPFGKWIKVKW